MSTDERLVMRFEKVAVVVILAMVLGCGDQGGSGSVLPVPVKEASGFKDVQMEARSQSQASALRYLRSHTKAGRVGDLLDEKMPEGVLVEGAGVVYGLNGRGTKNTPAGAEIHMRLMKSLLKEYQEPGMAARVLASTDSAPVTVEAVLPPFAVKGEKIDVKVQAFDRGVNLEGGMLGEVELEEFVQIPGQVKVDVMFTYSGRRASRGVQAYARGLVSVTPPVKDGRVGGNVSANVGYLTAGAMVKNPHGMVVHLKKGNAYEAVLIEFVVRERFHSVVEAADERTIRLALPEEYTENWERFMRVFCEVDPCLEDDGIGGRVESLMNALGSGDAKSRERAEYALEAIGNAAVPAMVRVVRISQGEKRLALLRVLTQLRVPEVGEELLRLSKDGSISERLEATRLLGRAKPKGAEAALTARLEDEDGRVRAEAIRSFERVGIREQIPVRWYFSPEKNLVISSSDVPGRNEVVVATGEAVKRIFVFGSMVNVNNGFKGGGTVVELNVTAGQTEIIFRHRADVRPAVMPTTDIRHILQKLDEAGVPINDILALIAELDKGRGLSAGVVWME